MATIKDIARLAGVSAATVSNVLNGKAGAASKQKASEILAVAESLQYRPNSLAKSLKLQRSNTIGIITEDLTVFNTPEIVDGIEECCEAQGYEIVLANMRLFKRYDNNLADTPEHLILFESTMQNLLAKQVEGIIYIGYHCRKIPYLPKHPDIPFAYAYCVPEQPLYPCVLFDDEEASYQVGKLLVEQGHHNIGVISGPLDSLNAQSRLRGFQRALYEAGVLYNASATLFGDWNQQSGYECAGALLEMGVTAIYAFNDIMASGVYSYCLDHGLTIGKDLSLFGYDNQAVSQACSPGISSVAPPLRTMGIRSAELVFAQMEENAEPVERCVLLPCEVLVRGSLGLCSQG